MQGGFPYKAMDWVSFFGIDTEASYPYANETAKSGKVPACDRNATGRVRAAVKATGHQLLNQTEECVSLLVLVVCAALLTLYIAARSS